MLPPVLKFNASAAAVRNRYAGAPTARFIPVTALDKAESVIGHSNVAFEEKNPQCAGVWFVEVKLNATT